MAKAATAETTNTGRELISGPRPAHLVSHGGGGGAGRTRQPTEFDDLVLEWYKKDDWTGIPATGDTDEEKANDLDEVYKATKRAADYHKLGIERIKDSEAGILWVNIRDKQGRGPTPGSIRDPETNKMVKPGTERYEELMAERNGDKNPNVVDEADHEF